MKRIAFVVLVIASLLLAACGNATADSQTSEDGVVTISFMMWGSPEELDVWNQVVADFEAQNPTINVEVDVSDWTSYWEKLNTNFAGGTPPDVFAMDAPLYMDWVTRDALLNLQPYIDANPTVLDGIYPITLEAYQLEDGYYGLPRDFQTIVLFYNEDMFDAAGLPYPDDTWTLETLREVAQQLTLDTNGDGVIDQWGFSTDLWDMELFWSEAIWSYGGEVISADHTQTLLGEGGAADAWQFIYDMAITDGSIPDPDTAGQFGGDPFDAGVSAMTTIGHWAVPQYATRGFNFDVAPFPAGPSVRATSVNSAGFVIAAESAHPDEAWQFIQFAIGPTGQTRLAELGFAIPVLQSIAESPVYLDQAIAINQQVFLDALDYAHPKPVFRGYDQWSTEVGDGFYTVWTGETTLADALAQIIPAADAVLAENQ
ncbi:MAG TPA: sugar ABC transporter substrate-binding protein [Longilinea sp.]|nr:sugar ABC transporter substrate-binding protein [Longilinea sp.]